MTTGDEANCHFCGQPTSDHDVSFTTEDVIRTFPDNVHDLRNPQWQGHVFLFPAACLRCLGEANDQALAELHSLGLPRTDFVAILAFQVQTAYGKRFYDNLAQPKPDRKYLWACPVPLPGKH